MSKVEHLFPARPEGRGTAKGADAVAAVNPVVEQLRSLASKLLIERLDRMFDGADDLLFEMAGRASTNAEQRVYFDTMRIVRLNRPTMLKVFRKEVEASFEPGNEQADEHDPAEAIEADTLTLQESSSLEKSIALSNMATKAEGQHKEALFELRRRLRWLSEARQVPISGEAIQPQQICDAFAASTASLDVEFATELVIYKLFDRCVIGELTDLYARTLALVRQLSQAMPSGFRTGAPGVAATPGKPAQGMPPLSAEPSFETVPMQPAMPGGGMGYAPPMAPQMGVPGPQMMPGMMPGHMPAAPGYAQPQGFVQTMGPMPAMQTMGPMPVPYGGGMAADSGMGAGATLLDPQTLQSLQRVSVEEMSGGVYTDGRLAHDISVAAQGQMVQGWGVQQAAAYVQRAGLVGRMFNTILADPNLPNGIKPQFDALRMSVIKSALKDVGFFADPKHPVRGLVNEVAEMAASARAAGADALSRIEDLVGEIQKQFDIAAESVRKPPEDAALILPDKADEFLNQQLTENDRRRRAIIDKTKRIVAEEQQLRMVGRRVPALVLPLLDSGWAPMMAMRLLRHGLDSPAWVEGLRLLDGLLDLVDPPTRQLPGEAVIRRLDDDLKSELLSVGLAANRVERLMQGLHSALAQQAVTLTEGTEIAASTVEPGSEPSQPLAEAGAAVVQAGAPAAVVEAAPVVEDSVEDLVDRLIVPGSWFRVFDRELDDSRWLRVVTRYGDTNRVAFSDFNGHQHWFIDAQELIGDLLDGRAGPIDFTPAAKRTLDQLRARVQGGGAVVT